MKGHYHEKYFIFNLNFIHTPDIKLAIIIFRGEPLPGRRFDRSTERKGRGLFSNHGVPVNKFTCEKGIGKAVEYLVAWLRHQAQHCDASSLKYSPIVSCKSRSILPHGGVSPTFWGTPPPMRRKTLSPFAGDSSGGETHHLQQARLYNLTCHLNT